MVVDKIEVLGRESYLVSFRPVTLNPSLVYIDPVETTVTIKYLRNNNDKNKTNSKEVLGFLSFMYNEHL